MEDNGRGLEGNPVKTEPAVKGGYPSSKELTVMLIGSVGRIRSFKISRKFLLYSSVSFAVYILISLVAFYFFFQLFFSYRAQSSHLEKLEAELRNKNRTLEQNELYISSLKDYLKTTGKTAESTDEQKPDEKVQEGTKPAAKAAEKTAESKTDPEEITAMSVEVKEERFQIDTSELVLNFKLANNLSEQNPAEGYVFILGLDKNRECPREWAYPQSELSDGFPVNYEHGQRFLIQNFRNYRQLFPVSPDSELPSFIRILVYDRSGNLILKKERPVKDESSS